MCRHDRLVLNAGPPPCPLPPEAKLSTLPTFRTAECSTCGQTYYGAGIQDALRQHHTAEGHELTTRVQPGQWTGGVFVSITDDATGAPITDIAEAARLLAIHCATDGYPFEIEGEDIEHGGYLATVDADAYMEASEEGGLDIYVDGHHIEIPMY